ncbi:hypothetical protein [Acidocella facilis]|nr:hypothetical protein [Acidocella facilis]
MNVWGGGNEGATTPNVFAAFLKKSGTKKLLQFFEEAFRPSARIPA